MKSVHTLRGLPVCIALLAALAACGAQRDDDADVRTSSPSDTTSETRDDAANDSAASDRDVEALAFLLAVDEHEVHAGAEAAKKDVRAEVKEFARTMQTDHGRHADETRDLAKTLNITLTDPPQVTSLKAKTAEERKSMAALQPEQFERAYLAAMVKDHEDVLAKIDEFLKVTKRIEVQTHLRASRGAIAHHLEMARNLQQEK
jgi:putative membrane protein